MQFFSFLKKILVTHGSIFRVNEKDLQDLPQQLQKIAFLKAAIAFINQCDYHQKHVVDLHYYRIKQTFGSFDASKHYIQPARKFVSADDWADDCPLVPQHFVDSMKRISTSMPLPTSSLVSGQVIKDLMPVKLKQQDKSKKQSK